MSRTKRRLITDVIPGRPAVRHTGQSSARSYAPRRYQPNRLVDVVYVRRHEPKRPSSTGIQRQGRPRSRSAGSVQAVPPAKGFRYHAAWKILPVAMAGVVLAVGVSVLVMTVVTNRRVVKQVSAESQSAASYDGQVSEGSAPGEEAVDEKTVRSYAVDPELPRLLEIERLDVLSRVRRMGTLRSGAVAAPANIHDTGWYEGSSRPGEGGAVLLVGHINGPSKPGVFAGLKNLRAGDIISLARGDGQRFQYRVVSKEQVPAEKVDMKKALIAVTPGKNGLNLMTCAGTAINGGAEYTDRIIVYTEQL